MVNFTTAASMASLFLSIDGRRQQASQEAQREAAQESRGDETNGLNGELAELDALNEKLDRMVQIENQNQPTPADRDAYASAVLELSNGEVAEVVVEPVAGWNLRVKEVHMDRRDDHSYEINVGGDVTGVSHRAKYAAPRTVTQSDRVVATVVNESGSSSVVDFEMIAWAERPASDGVK